MTMIAHPRRWGVDRGHQAPLAAFLGGRSRRIVATVRGRMTAFVFDTAAPRSLDRCVARVALEVELRSRLALFPERAKRDFRDLSSQRGCGS